MSSGANNNTPFWPTWRSGHDYGAYAPTNSNDPNRIEPIFRHSLPFQATAVSIFLLQPRKVWLKIPKKVKERYQDFVEILRLDVKIVCSMFVM